MDPEAGQISSFKVLPRSPEQGQQANGSNNRKRSSSFTGFIKNILPSHRPERGSTLRERGYWEKIDAQMPEIGEKARRRGVDYATGDDIKPDQLTQLNPARELTTMPPEDNSPAFCSRRGQAPPVTNELGTVDSTGRRWSWSPRKEAEALTVKSSKPATQKEEQQIFKRSAKPNLSNLFLLSQQKKTPIDRVDATSRVESVRRRLARRNRRSLKESGDYLGVTGCNPESGELDIISPTSSSQSSFSLHTKQKIGTLADVAKQTVTTYDEAMNHTQEKMKNIPLKRAKSRQILRDRQSIRLTQKRIRWEKGTRDWSSAQEPNLSPIAQSQRTISPRLCR
jgi:hypothetical protein